jgi:hypothetical protein
VAHVYNPSYSGGRDQEDHGLRLAGANSLGDPIWKKPFTKKGLVEFLPIKHEALSSNPNTAKTKPNPVKSIRMELDMVAYTCNSSIQETEAGGLSV